MAVMVFAFWQEDTTNEFFSSADFKNLKADLVLYGVRYRRDTRARASQWVVQAESARFFEKRKECEFDKVEIVFMPHGKEPVTVISQKGLYDFSRGSLRVSGNVTVKGFKDYTLYADLLLYDPKSMTIKVPGAARLVGAGGSRLLGNSMVYEVEHRKLTLSSPVATIPEEETGTQKRSK